MTIVVDTNVFVCVFEDNNADHSNFKPVLDWINKGFGFLVYGGSTYNKELIKSYHRARFVRLMRDAGRAVEIKTAVVDSAERRVKSLTRGTNCNDQHIIALLGAANCPLLCSADRESFPHIKNRSLYPDNSPRVKIYSGKRNKGILVKTLDSSIKNKK